jgi:hypothetical protein
VGIGVGRGLLFYIKLIRKNRGGEIYDGKIPSINIQSGNPPNPKKKRTKKKIIEKCG